MYRVWICCQILIFIWNRSIFSKSIDKIKLLWYNNLRIMMSYALIEYISQFGSVSCGSGGSSVKNRRNHHYRNWRALAQVISRETHQAKSEGTCAGRTAFLDMKSVAVFVKYWEYRAHFY